ncbi:hypothetical protein [Intestinibacter bartlettii]|uniref:Aconitase A/isopropylmalate dehydratase small subunit swivel domain-containing protein n=1 Tax=Intestinibacter bartlettii TaxID=261299 RepID=A0ABS6DWA7_9FIRM|nr:hypothetical protein [Intestinibacter bartlettii]MBU5335718.1 hypothetical protein [Intestinibacter bartlettii]
MDINFNEITSGVMIKLSDNIEKDDILSSDEKFLEDQSNIDIIAKTCFKKIDKGFINRVTFNKGGFIVCGDNLLQQSSDSDVEKVFSHLGIKGIIAKSFNEKHKDNLIKNGIIPMQFIDDKQYNDVGLYDILKVKNLLEDLSKGIVEVVNITKGDSFFVKTEL